jgi:hypothetical protein
MVLPVGRGALLRLSCHLRRDLIREGARQLDEASLDEGQAQLPLRASRVVVAERQREKCRRATGNEAADDVLDAAARSRDAPCPELGAAAVHERPGVRVGARAEGDELHGAVVR